MLAPFLETTTGRLVKTPPNKLGFLRHVTTLKFKTINDGLKFFRQLG